MSLRERGKFVVFLFALALVLRFGYVTMAERIDPVLRGDALYQDARDYHERALHLIAGQGYTADGTSPDLRRAPGYPFFLAAFYRAFGARPEPVRIVHALLGALTCLLVYSIGCGLSRDPEPASARLAGILTAIHPILIYMTAWLYAETVFIFLLFLGLWLLQVAALPCSVLGARCSAGWGRSSWVSEGPVFVGPSTEHRAPSTAFLAGVVFGVAALMRSSALGLTFFLLAALPVLRLRAWDCRPRWTGLAALALGTVLVVLPWSLRNYRCCGRVVPINAEAGWLFWLSNHARADGGYGTPFGAYFPRGDVNLADRDRYLMRAGVRWVREHPVEWLRLCVRKWQRFWSPATMGHASEVRLPQAFLAAYALFLGCAAVGAVRTFRIWREGRLLHAVCAYFVLIALFFYGCTRFALPIAPCLCLFAAEGMYWALGFFSPPASLETQRGARAALLRASAVRKPGCAAPPAGASDA